MSGPFEVSGDPDPDATGTYEHAGEYETWPYFVRQGGGYTLWRHLVHGWFISATLGDRDHGLWWPSSFDIEGFYDGAGPFTGFPIIHTSATLPLLVTGDPGPDCTGHFAENGTHNAKPTYRDLSEAWWIWWETSPAQWTISTAVGNQGANYWTLAQANPPGSYTPGGSATGNPIVAYD